MMRGKLEAVRQGTVTGWLWDERRPSAHVAFDLFVNGTTVSQVIASCHRADLRKHHIGEGDHAFSVQLAPAWHKVGLNEICVRIAGEPADLIAPCGLR